MWGSRTVAVIESRLRPVHDSREIHDGRPGVEVLEHSVAPRAFSTLGDPAGRVLPVAELDRARGTGLSAGGDDVAVLQGPILEARLVLSAPDPLDAEGALLHHAPGPDRHVRIELPVERLDEGLLGEREPVEIPNFVGAVV